MHLVCLLHFAGKHLAYDQSKLFLVPMLHPFYLDIDDRVDKRGNVDLIHPTYLTAWWDVTDVFRLTKKFIITTKATTSPCSRYVDPSRSTLLVNYSFTQTQIHSKMALAFCLVAPSRRGSTNRPLRCLCPHTEHGDMLFGSVARIGPIASRPARPWARLCQRLGRNPRVLTK